MSNLEQYKVDKVTPMIGWIDLTVSPKVGTTPYTPVRHVYLWNFLPANKATRCGHENPCGSSATIYLNGTDFTAAQNIKETQNITYFSDPVPNTIIELLSNFFF
jgi:hypothetical protein